MTLLGVSCDVRGGRGLKLGPVQKGGCREFGRRSQICRSLKILPPELPTPTPFSATAGAISTKIEPTVRFLSSLDRTHHRRRSPFVATVVLRRPALQRIAGPPTPTTNESPQGKNPAASCPSNRDGDYSNIYTCLNGSKASSYCKFNIMPPTLEDYLEL